jgi:hypothetical protein
MPQHGDNTWVQAHFSATKILGSPGGWPCWNYAKFLLIISISTVYAYEKAKLGQKLRNHIVFLFNLSLRPPTRRWPCRSKALSTALTAPGDLQPLFGGADTANGPVWSISHTFSFTQHGGTTNSKAPCIDLVFLTVYSYVKTNHAVFYAFACCWFQGYESDNFLMRDNWTSSAKSNRLEGAPGSGPWQKCKYIHDAVIFCENI